MFMVTLHKDSWKKAAAMLGCAVILCGVLLGANSLADGARAAAAAADGRTVKSAADMADFLLGYGVEADVSTAQVLQVTIPRKFDSSFRAFNEVIQSCGMDLTRYKGKMVEKWVLQSPNRTVEDQTAYAVLLVKDAKVIGGYLLYQPSGEVLGLRDKLDAAALAEPQQAVAAAQSEAAQAEVGAEAQPQQECAADEAEPAAPIAAQDPTGDTPTAAEEGASAEEVAAGAEEEQAGIYPID